MYAYCTVSFTTFLLPVSHGCMVAQTFSMTQRTGFILLLSLPLPGGTTFRPGYLQWQCGDVKIPTDGIGSKQEAIFPMSVPPLFNFFHD